MRSERRQRLVAGSALILLGLVLWWVERTRGIGAGAVFFIVGSLFLAGYLARRAYALLVPAGILLGLGAGTLADDLKLGIFWRSGALLGLGCGFVAIWVVALLYERRSHWWPLVPGAVLILAGLGDLSRVFDYFQRNWPLLLVLIGLMILLGAFGRRRPRGDAKSG